MKNSINAAEQLRRELENTPACIKHDFIQKYVENTYHMRDYCSDMIDVMTDLKNKSNTSKEKEKCALLIKKMQVFLEIYEVLVEEYIRQNSPSTSNSSEMTNSICQKNCP